MSKIYALTGGIASGKSTVSKWFTELGYNVVDCDKIVAELYDKQILKDKVRQAFGDAVFNLNGTIDRKKLGQLVFHNASEREKLNQIIHPLVFDTIDHELSRITSEIVIIDMPLFYEVNYQKANKVICVYTELETRIARLAKRDNISKEYALTKINAQMDLDIKKDRSDFVIDNSGSIEETKEQFNRLLNKL